MNSPNTEPRWILAGSDQEILPLLELSRAEGGADVVALYGKGQSSLSELYSQIMNIPFSTETIKKGQQKRAEALVTDLHDGDLPAKLPRIGINEAMERLQSAAASPALEPSNEGQNENDDSLVAGDEIDEERGLDPGVADESVAAPEEGGRTEATAVSGEPRDLDEAAFRSELEREILRSKRYHLGFCLTLIRISYRNGRHPEPDQSFCRRIAKLTGRSGRETDSWGLTGDGMLMHLAPETHEAAAMMRKRLLAALKEESKTLPGAPWGFRIGQVLFPGNGESSEALLSLATTRLEQSRIHGGTQA